MSDRALQRFRDALLVALLAGLALHAFTSMESIAAIDRELGQVHADVRELRATVMDHLLKGGGS